MSFLHIVQKRVSKCPRGVDGVSLPSSGQQKYFQKENVEAANPRSFSFYSWFSIANSLFVWMITFHIICIILKLLFLSDISNCCSLGLLGKSNHHLPAV